MANLRIPLVLSDQGEDEQLQAGDLLSAPAVSGGFQRILTNGDAGNHVRGNAVYLSGSNTAQLSCGDGFGTADTFAICADAIVGTGALGNYIEYGDLTATTGEWDTVTGGSGGLSPGWRYFLSTVTPGNITKTIPSAAGTNSKCLGHALSSTVFHLALEPTIDL